jgi:hypothetical protein
MGPGMLLRLKSNLFAIYTPVIVHLILTLGVRDTQETCVFPNVENSIQLGEQRGIYIFQPKLICYIE